MTRNIVAWTIFPVETSCGTGYRSNCGRYLIKKYFSTDYLLLDLRDGKHLDTGTLKEMKQVVQIMNRKRK